jgi:hypothetical protein
MLGFFPISAAPISSLSIDAAPIIVVQTPAGAYGNSNKRKLYIIDGEKVYLNKAELDRALDVLKQPAPDPVKDAPEKPVENSVPYKAQENDLAGYMAYQAELAAQQAEIQRRLEIQAAAEREILMRWMEERKRDEEEALLVLL